MTTAPLHRHPGGTLAVASIAAFMTSIDMMVVTTAIPTLRRSLGVMLVPWSGQLTPTCWRSPACF